jgi:hypothetical protein
MQRNLMDYDNKYNQNQELYNYTSGGHTNDVMQVRR